MVTTTDKSKVSIVDTDIYTKRAQAAIDAYVRKRLAASANAGSIADELGILRERIEAKKSNTLSSSTLKQIDALLKVIDAKVSELSR